MRTYSRELLSQTLTLTNTTPWILGRGRRARAFKVLPRCTFSAPCTRKYHGLRPYQKRLSDELACDHSWNSKGRMRHPQTCMSLRLIPRLSRKNPAVTSSTQPADQAKCSTTAVVLGLIGNHNRQKDLRYTNHWQAASQTTSRTSVALRPNTDT